MWRAAALSGCTATIFSGRLLAERSCLPSLRIDASMSLHAGGKMIPLNQVETCWQPFSFFAGSL